MNSSSAAVSCDRPPASLAGITYLCTCPPRKSLDEHNAPSSQAKFKPRPSPLGFWAGVCNCTRRLFLSSPFPYLLGFAFQSIQYLMCAFASRAGRVQLKKYCITHKAGIRCRIRHLQANPSLALRVSIGTTVRPINRLLGFVKH